MNDTTARIAIALSFALGSTLQQYHRFRYRQERKPGQEPLHRLRLIVTNLYTLLLALYVFLPNSVAFANIGLAGQVRAIGLPFLVVAPLLWLWSQACLAENWSGSVAIRNNHTITRTGPYRYVRHPMYTSFILLGIGIILASANWLIMISVGFGIYLTVCRAPQEEALMLRHFGNAYEQYREGTGMFFPGF